MKQSLAAILTDLLLAFRNVMRQKRRAGFALAIIGGGVISMLLAGGFSAAGAAVLVVMIGSGAAVMARMICQARMPASVTMDASVLWWRGASRD